MIIVFIPSVSQNHNYEMRDIDISEFDNAHEKENKSLDRDHLDILFYPAHGRNYQHRDAEKNNQYLHLTSPSVIIKEYDEHNHKRHPYNRENKIRNPHYPESCDKHFNCSYCNRDDNQPAE